MEIIPHTEELINLIDFKLLFLIVAMSRWSKRYLKNIFSKILLSHKILFLSTLISVVYFFVGRHMGFITNESFFILLITYFTATSFYELIFYPIENMIKKKIGGENDEIKEEE